MSTANGVHAFVISEIVTVYITQTILAACLETKLGPKYRTSLTTEEIQRSTGDNVTGDKSQVLRTRNAYFKALANKRRNSQDGENSRRYKK